MDYFYDAQLRRYIAQFLRIFSNIKYRTDPDENGFSIEARVPIKYGDMSRMVASILADNSENKATPVIPAMAGYVSGLEMEDERRHDPTLVTSVQAKELRIDEQTGKYIPEVGNSYTVERYMPVPYKLSMKLDVITSNTSTKMQILEQILTIFNPMIELQQNENPLDWSRVFQVSLKSVNWTNRSIPMGDNLDYDVATLEFFMPVWINPPAKEKRQRIINNIVTRVFEGNGGWDYDDGDVRAQINLTSENLRLEVLHTGSVYQGQLLRASGAADPTLTWESRMKTLGTIIPDRSRIKLRTADDLDDTSGDIYGNIIGINETDPTKIDFTIDGDTLPPTISQSPVTAIIDPTMTYPGNGINLANTSIVHRYMILGKDDSNDALITTYNQHWGGIVAHNNDIIEYVDGDWIIVFDSSSEQPNHFMENLADGNHYRFDGEDWVYTILGVYNPVYWSILDIQIP